MLAARWRWCLWLMGMGGHWVAAVCGGGAFWVGIGGVAGGMTSVPYSDQDHLASRAPSPLESGAIRRGAAPDRPGALFVAPLVVALHRLDTLSDRSSSSRFATSKTHARQQAPPQVRRHRPDRRHAHRRNFQIAVAKSIAFAFASATTEVVVGFLVALAFVTLLKLGDPARHRPAATR